ncbi:MAG: histidine kinase [Sphingomonas bacterium]|nr:histidine kinase [Sphingomonas bacterium]
MKHVRVTPLPSAVGMRTRFADWPLALRSIAGFWLFYLGTVLLRALLGPEAASAMTFRVINALVGVGLTLLIYLALALLARGASVRRMATVAAIAALPAAMILSFVSLRVATRTMPMGEQSRITTQEGLAIVQHGSNVRIVKNNGDQLEMNLPPIEQIIAAKMPRLIADGTVTWYFLFAAWSAIFIAMTQQQLARLTERRLAVAETAAHAAQVRALRYQVNPHFLFNTLNSISSLVMSGHADRAEEMLMALSTFFRTSLSLDPSANVTLAQEIELQRLYLDIEMVRFPKRLKVSIDVPDDLAGAFVPALILQPLVENAIKYGVSATRDPVLLTIEARRLDGGRMQIDVINRLAKAGKTTPAAKPAHEGTGLGLANVCQRLEAHFGERADCRFGPIAGGYQVSIALPIDNDD